MIIQLADPVIIQWIMDTARKAAEEAGRDPSELKCIVCAPSHITDDIADAREQVRWFPAMVSNHVMDLIERYGFDSEIPHELTEYVRVRKFYDYDEHSRVGAKHGEFVTDEICDRFCVLGNAEQATAKLKELEAIGVDQFNIYLMTHGQEEELAAYGKDIIPQFSGVEAWATADLEDRLPERARDELDCGQRGRVLAVEDRVDLDDLERPGEPRLGDELEREVGFAVGETSAHGRSDAGRNLGIERVHVERDMDEPGAADPVERLPHRPLDADAVDLAHREHPHARFRSSRRSPSSSWRVPDECDAAADRPPAAARLALESASPARPSAAAEAHPVDVSGRARLRRVDVRSARRSRARRPARALMRDRRGCRARPSGRRRGRAGAPRPRRLRDERRRSARTSPGSRAESARARRAERVASGSRSPRCPRHEPRSRDSASRSSRPASRIADGPMSTPRRPCPRSSAAPMIAISRCPSSVTARNLTPTAATLRCRGEVAQLVEHTAENRGVAGSSPALAISRRW